MSMGGASGGGATAYTGGMAELGDIGFGAGNYGPGYSSGPSASPAYASGNVAPLGDIGFGAGNLWAGGDANKPGTDWAKLAGALGGGLGKSGGGGGGGEGGGAMASAGQSSASIGRGGGSNLFNEVLQAMLKRQQLYAGNANPQGATPVAGGRQRGMLGI